jgi:hypothetical protein
MTHCVREDPAISRRCDTVSARTRGACSSVPHYSHLKWGPRQSDDKRRNDSRILANQSCHLPSSRKPPDSEPSIGPTLWQAKILMVRFSSSTDIENAGENWIFCRDGPFCKTRSPNELSLAAIVIIKASAAIPPGSPRICNFRVPFWSPFIRYGIGHVAGNKQHPISMQPANHLE